MYVMRETGFVDASDCVAMNSGDGNKEESG
jgi:hypothetical protein